MKSLLNKPFLSKMCIRDRCKAAHMTGNAVMNRMAEEYLSDLAAGRDRSRELLSLVEGVKERDVYKRQILFMNKKEG